VADVMPFKIVTFDFFRTASPPLARNDRGDDGNVSIIRSLVRAIVLPGNRTHVRDLGKFVTPSHHPGCFESNSKIWAQAGWNRTFPGLLRATKVAIRRREIYRLNLRQRP
jgi:hypothetical protein